MAGGFLSLSLEDYATLNLNHWEDRRIIDLVHIHLQRNILENVSHRLATIEWIMRQLREKPPGLASIFHDIVSQAVYMLLSCAESLGKQWETKNWDQFNAFFMHLPASLRSELLDGFLVQECLWPAPGASIVVPDRAQMLHHRATLDPDAAWEEFIACLYGWRNMATHDAGHPAMSGSPDFAVVYRHFFPDAAMRDNQLRVPMAIPRERQGKFYWVFMQSGDPVADLRRAVVRGLGVVLGL